MPYLVLSSEIAGQVREQLASTDPVYVPVARAGGVFVLPASVLQVEAHASVRAVLAPCPSLPPDDAEFPAALDPED